MMQNKKTAPCHRVWQKSDISSLVLLHREGCTLEELALLLGRTVGSVKSAIKKVRAGSEYDLPKRETRKVNRIKPKDAPLTSWDIQYRGAVPLKHWTITKPWR